MQIEEVVRKFESCEYSPAEFTHARHLTVAAWYLSQFTEGQAMERMRACLIRFSQHHGKMGYHETITRFWLQVVAQSLKEAEPGTPLVTIVNKLVQEWGNKELLFRHYSRELVMSEAARAEWVEPDLEQLQQH